MSSSPCLRSQARTRLATTSRPGRVSSSQACDASSRLAPSSLFAPCLPCCGAMPAAPTLAAPVVVKSCLVTPCLRCLGLATLAGSSLDFTAVPAVPTCAERSDVEPSLEPSRRAMPAGPGLAMGRYVPSSLATPAVRSPVRRRHPGKPCAAMPAVMCAMPAVPAPAASRLVSHVPSALSRQAKPAAPGRAVPCGASPSDPHHACDACGAKSRPGDPREGKPGHAMPAVSRDSLPGRAMRCLATPAVILCGADPRPVWPGGAQPVGAVPAVMGAVPAGASTRCLAPSCIVRRDPGLACLSAMPAGRSGVTR